MQKNSFKPMSETVLLFWVAQPMPQQTARHTILTSAP